MARARIDANEKNRLLPVDTEPLLAGFRHKPGSHPWIGEHVGKWLHAATLAWAYSGDPALRAKLDRVADELVRCQEPDGYLGTYVPEKRFGLYPGDDWDVWSHKYNLIGLLTYYQYTGNTAGPAGLPQDRRLAHRHIPGQEEHPGRRHALGMAATSVLEPVVLLYRLTGDAALSRFRPLHRPGLGRAERPEDRSPRCWREKQVHKTANGKAYEMLSNLVGLCELARVTGDRAMLTPCSTPGRTSSTSGCT